MTFNPWSYLKTFVKWIIWYLLINIIYILIIEWGWGCYLYCYLFGFYAYLTCKPLFLPFSLSHFWLFCEHNLSLILYADIIYTLYLLFHIYSTLIIFTLYQIFIIYTLHYLSTVHILCILVIYTFLNLTVIYIFSTFIIIYLLYNLPGFSHILYVYTQHII